jgi:predicted DsbA family dithiol-disulfide isomerase
LTLASTASTLAIDAGAAAADPLVPKPPATLTIDIVSDVVCPWCYIGKRKLEAALALAGAADLPPVQIRWHPFQLNPDLPEAGMPRKQYLEDKFGGPARAAEIYARVHAAGAAVGLDLNFDAIQQQANTLAAHALIAFAQQDSRNGPDNEVGNRVKELLLKAYFVEGRFIGSVDVLTEIAVEAGLDGDAARAYISDAAHRADIAQADAQARQMGVSGVPFFIFNQKVAVSGAQDPQTLLAAMQQAVAEAA